LAEWGTGSFTGVASLSPGRFKRAMVSKVRDLETPEDEAIVRMAHVYHHFDAEILDTVYPQLGEIGFAPEQVIQSLSRFSFVKYWPETDDCLLHDEIQRLVEQYVWDEIDPAKDVRRAISTEVVNYYDKALAKEPNERERWILEAERMYHRLYSDLAQGRPEFWRTADEAWTQYKLDFVAMLLSKGEEVNAKLKDPFLDVINRVMRTWVNLEEWHLEDARELAQSVLDHSACTQRTRATALAALGVYADRKGEGDLAIERYQKALELYRDLEERLVQGEALLAEHGIPRLKGVRAEIAMLLNSVGIVQRHKGLFDEAIVSYNQAREVARQEADLEWLAAALNNIGNVERLRGNLSLARNLCAQALQYRERLQGEHPGAAYLRDIGLSHNTLGMVLRDMQEHDLAQEHFTRAEGGPSQSQCRLGMLREGQNCAEQKRAMGMV
jgi:tetratricopeptide (TPR) repeat protein